MIPRKLRSERMLPAAGLALLLAGCLPGTQQQVVMTDPTWSHGGDRIAFVSTQDGDAEIYVVGVDGTGLRQLTTNEAIDASPDWSPDDSRILFVSDREGDFALYVMRADGSQVEPLELEKKK